MLKLVSKYLFLKLPKSCYVYDESISVRVGSVKTEV